MCFFRLLALLAILCTVAPVWAAASNTGEATEIKFQWSATSDPAYPLASEASTLASPVAIYEYVRNNYEYALYQGARSGSINTFLGKRGNDVDLAATLIAMLRSAGYPARYAVATVRVPTSKVMNWLRVEDADLAYALMRDQGLQGVTLSADKTTIDFEHVWVEALVPYGDYRGAGASTTNCVSTPAACNWVPLDPSFKQYEYSKSGIDPYTGKIGDATVTPGGVKFDYDAYYQAIKNNDAARLNKNPLEIYQNQLIAWLQTNAPGKTLADIPDFGGIIAETDGLLPNSLPFITTSIVRRYNSAADHDAQIQAPGTEVTWTEAKNWTKYVTVTPYFNGQPFIGVTEDLVTVSTQRLTYTFGSTTDSSGTRLLQAFRLDGVQKGTAISISASGQTTINGELINVGSPLLLHVTMDGPPAPDGNSTDVTITADYNAIIGGYYLIATGGETSNWSQVHRAAQQLLTANQNYTIVFDPSEPSTNTNCQLPASSAGCTPYLAAPGASSYESGDVALLDSPQALDDLTGGLLAVAANQYFAGLHDKWAQLDQLNKVKTPIFGFLGVVSATDEVEYVDGTAFSVLPGGLLIDMKGIKIGGSWRIDAPDNYSSSEFEMAGHIGSSLEHETWQELTGYDAISTVRGIQMALSNGAAMVNPIKNASTDTIASMYPAFGFSSSAPTGFARNVYSIFGQNYVAWSNPTSTAEFVALRPNIQGLASSDPGTASWTYSADNGVDTALSQYRSTYNTLLAAQTQANTLINQNFTSNSGYYAFYNVIKTSWSTPSGFAVSSYNRIDSTNYNFAVSETSLHPDGTYNLGWTVYLAAADGSLTYTGTGFTGYQLASATIASPAGFAINSATIQGDKLKVNLKRTSAADGSYTVTVNVVLTQNGNTYTASPQWSVTVVNGQLLAVTLPLSAQLTIHHNSDLTCGENSYTNQTPAVLLGYLQTCFNNFVAANSGYFNFFTPTASLEFRAVPAAADDQLTTQVQKMRNDLYGQDTSKAWVDYLIPSKLSTGPYLRFEVDIRRAHDSVTNQDLTATYGILNEWMVPAGGGLVREPESFSSTHNIDAHCAGVPFRCEQ